MPGHAKKKKNHYGFYLFIFLNKKSIPANTNLQVWEQLHQDLLVQIPLSSSNRSLDQWGPRKQFVQAASCQISDYHKTTKHGEFDA